MQQLTRRPLVLVAALSLITACQSADRSPVGSTEARQQHGLAGSTAAAAAVPIPAPVPVPGGAGPAPVPGGGGGGYPKPAPVPVPGAPNSGPAPGTPDKPEPEPSATPSPDATPAPGPTPTPPPTINVTISGPNAADFEVVPVSLTTADAVLPRHRDETWRETVRHGDVLIRTTNAKRNDLTETQAVLDISASEDVVALLRHTAPEQITWDEAEGFAFTGSATSWETPTEAEPSSSDVFSIREKVIGRSGQARLGPNFETPPTAACEAERNCRPMYWLIIRRQGAGRFSERSR